MNATPSKRVSRFLTLFVSATLLAGCFGEGEGPTPIAGTPAPPPPVIPPGFCDIINFEDVCGPFTFTDFEGGATAIVDNPDVSGLNMTDRVVRMQKFEVVGGGTFGGSQLALPGGMDFTAGEAFIMRVWSSRQVPVLFKFEGLNQERSIDHSGSGTWEEICYDFTGTTAGPAATGITVIFDLTVMGNAGGDPDNWTFYFDEIEQVASCGGGGGPGTPIALPVTFDDGDAAFYELTDFGGVTTTLVADPDNAANTVASTNKPPGAELWGGTTVADASGFGALPFTATDTTMTLRVYSPDAGIPVRLKVEDVTNNTISVETEAMTTVAGAWETLTFDFSSEVAGTAALNLANTYDKASVFFNFGTDGNTAGDRTYLWEDLAFVTGGGGGTGIALPVTFDAGDAAFYELTDFGGVATTLVADPDNAANTVASTNKPPGAELWGGTTVAETSGFGALPFTATDTTMTLRVYSPDAGIPVRLKVEDVTNNTISVETEAMTTVAGAWETLTFDFSSEVAGTAALNLANTYDKASVFFNFGTDGNTAGDRTYLWEDLAFVTGGGGGTGIALPVTFDAGDAAFYELTDFGGVATTLVADPDNAANTVASTNKPPGAELWGGTTVADTTGFGALPFSATDTTMTLRVYSPDAGIPVRLKVEDRTNPAISVETEASTTVANAWETLTFDFSNPAAGTAALDLANTYDKGSVFFNFGTDGNTAGDRTYLWEDLAFVTGGGSGGTGMTSTDFEGGSYTFNDFGGGVATVVANPDASGINVSAQVAQMQKFAGELFAGSTLDLGGPVELAAADSYTMKVRAQRSVVVTFKLETGQQETTATHSGSGTWEELCFDFTNVATTVTGITVIFDNGTAGDAANFPDDWTFQIDDIQQISGSCPATGPTFAPITFDDAAVTYTLTDFGGNTSVVTNDPAGGTNMVAQFDKSDTAELWAGTTISTEVNDSVPTIPLDAANTTMTVRVYSPDAGIPVRLKIEDASNGAISVETEAMTTAVNTWETLTFDFSNQAAGTPAFNEANTYNKISIFFNFGTTGATAGARTYYADDIEVASSSGGGTGITLPVTFDAAGLDYELQDFGGVTTTLIADPLDGANTVASTNKPPGAELWGGTTVANVTGFGALPFSATDTTMTLRVYSPDAGIPVRLKVEDVTNAAISVETEAMTTVANAWETLTFDFSNQAAGTPALNTANTYDKASVFFNFGTDGNTAGDRTYLWEDLTFVTAGGGGSGFVNGDFETGDFTGWVQTRVPDGVGSIAIDNSAQGGRTGSVARLITDANATRTNDVLISQVALAAGTVTAGDSIDVSFDLYGTLSGAGGVVFVEVIFLDATGQDVGGRDFVGPAAPYVPTTTWTTHSGTVIAGTATGGGTFDVSGGVTLQLKAACGAIDGCGVDASFDNVTFTIN